MYISNNFEPLFIRYKAESVPSGESLQAFCIRHGVPYNLFEKWYKDTRHKVILTCRMHGISTLEYLRKFFRKIVLGRRDYENLLPMTIGIKTNKF